MSIRPLILLVLISVLATNSAFAASVPVVAGYWSNWGIYWPERPYAVTDSKNNGVNVSNPDLDSQLEKLDIVNYAFLEVNTNAPTQDANTGHISMDSNNGSLYFYDPWADLSSADTEFCARHSAMCQHQEVNWSRGNFHALLAHMMKVKE